jgi:hypothetical protein
MNAFETRTIRVSVAFNRIADTDVLHLSMMGTHLNGGTVATDLLERRSVAYADRVCR